MYKIDKYWFMLFDLTPVSPTKIMFFLKFDVTWDGFAININLKDEKKKKKKKKKKECEKTFPKALCS